MCFIFFHVNAHRNASFGFHFDSVRANNFHNKTFNWRRWVYVCVCEWFKPVGCNTRWTRVCFSLLPSQSWIGTDMLNKLNGPLWLHWCNTDKVIVNGFLEKTVKKKPPADDVDVCSDIHLFLPLFNSTTIFSLLYVVVFFRYGGNPKFKILWMR